jgi:hypothetical protein
MSPRVAMAIPTCQLQRGARGLETRRHLVSAVSYPDSSASAFLKSGGKPPQSKALPLKPRFATFGQCTKRGVAA